MARRTAFILAWLALPFLSPAAQAFSTTPIHRKVPLNAEVEMRDFYFYTTKNCRSLPPPAVAARTPTLGAVSTEVVNIKPTRGPCGAEFRYEAVRVKYRAGGKDGRDKFVLYVSNGNNFTPVPVDILVGTPAKVAQPAPGSSCSTQHKACIRRGMDATGVVTERVHSICTERMNVCMATGKWTMPDGKVMSLTRN